jgi:hypothetical protein
MRLTLPGQLDLPDTGERPIAKIKAAEPMRPAVPQKPCDIGLFSDEANQLDFIERLNP